MKKLLEKRIKELSLRTTKRNGTPMLVVMSLRKKPTGIKVSKVCLNLIFCVAGAQNCLYDLTKIIN